MKKAVEENKESAGSNALRAFYVLAAVGLIIPLFLTSGWVMLAMGMGFSSFIPLAPLTIPALIIWRVVYVIRKPAALASPSGHPVAALIRILGLVLMAIGALACFGTLAGGSLTRALIGSAGDAGIVHFVSGIYLYLLSSSGWAGLILFEFGRWLAKTGEQTSLRLRRAITFAVCAVLAAGIGVWMYTRQAVEAQHTKFVQLCKIAREPKVLATYTAPVESILMQQGSLRGAGSLTHLYAEFLAASEKVAFVESCRGTHCYKFRSTRLNNPSYVDQTQIKAPQSLIAFGPAEPKIYSSRFGARVLDIRYEVRVRDTGKVLAYGSEWAFDRDDEDEEEASLFNIVAVIPEMLGFRRRSSNRPEMENARMEACGYARPGIYGFRASSFGGKTTDAYVEMDLRLLQSVLLSMQETKPVDIDAVRHLKTPEAAPTEAMLPPLLDERAQARLEPKPSSTDTPVFYEPPVRSSVVWKGDRGTVVSGGLIAVYCCAGTHSTTVASKSVGSGKHYWELTFYAGDGKHSPKSWTNLGVVSESLMKVGRFTPHPQSRKNDGNSVALIGNAESSRFQSGDVFMLALDADAAVVYYGVNGRWLTREPGQSGGERLASDGKPWMPFANVSASKTETEGDRWMANFGGAAYRYPIPKGYAAYGTHAAINVP